jgi:hypothetical protein
VVFGKAGGFGANLNLSTLSGADGFQISGEAASDYSGRSVFTAGDVNGDGFDDLLIGAPLADPNGLLNTGASYVVFGAAGGFGANLDLSALIGTNGFRISGEAFGDRFGYSVSAAGDVNGDGFDDLVIGAWGADPNGLNSAGASYVVFGKASGFGANLDLSALDGTNGFQISGEAARDNSGRLVSAAGDVNGDGFEDLLIGAFGTDPNGSYSGASYVVFGKASGFGANLDLSALDGTNGFKISSEAGDFTGRWVSAAGDVNGDGFEDLLIGARLADPNAPYSGASYVVFGKASGFGANLDLSVLDGTNGFQISGAANDQSGFSVSAAEDVNGDGFDDLLIGAPFAGPNGVASGASYVVFGEDYRGEVDFAGTPGNNNLSGTAADEILISGLGDDTLDGAGGVDVVRGGAGDDMVVFDGTDRVVDGGRGHDTLQFTGFGESLDFTDIVDTRYTGIEIVDLTGTGDNSITLETLDLLALSDSTNTLRVDGDSGDSVISTGQGWVAGGTVDVGGTLYERYTDGAATLLLHPEVDSGSLIS